MDRLTTALLWKDAGGEGAGDTSREKKLEGRAWPEGKPQHGHRPLGDPGPARVAVPPQPALTSRVVGTVRWIRRPEGARPVSAARLALCSNDPCPAVEAPGGQQGSSWGRAGGQRPPSPRPAAVCRREMGGHRAPLSGQRATLVKRVSFPGDLLQHTPHPRAEQPACLLLPIPQEEGAPEPDRGDEEVSLGQRQRGVLPGGRRGR